MSIFPVFGNAPSGARLQRIKRSPNFSNGSFQNLVPTSVMRKDSSFLQMLKEYRNRPADIIPPGPIPHVDTDLRTLPENQATLVWFGHSSYLLKFGKTHILVDPVFSGNASPVSFFAKAFPGANTYGVDDMPARLEAVLITHDHYDHLDYKTILRLKDRTTHFYTSLGVGAHLESWGIEPGRITELDWFESCTIDEAGRPSTANAESHPGGFMSLTATPARHFSGRFLKRGGTLWSSFVLKAPGYSLYLGGDSGYEQHFKAIGERFGPFDLAVLECGQYGHNWPNIHMLPEETVMAAQDLRAATLLPVHWAKFTLSIHPWDEPIRRITAATAKANMGTAAAKTSMGTAAAAKTSMGTAAAAKASVALTTPRIGEPVVVNGNYPREAWWLDV
jgi:L-ascorbate metabolism protein UlaG (beta-lactamase superfamily)